MAVTMVPLDDWLSWNNIKILFLIAMVNNKKVLFGHFYYSCLWVNNLLWCFSVLFWVVTKAFWNILFIFCHHARMVNKHRQQTAQKAMIFLQKTLNTVFNATFTYTMYPAGWEAYFRACGWITHSSLSGDPTRQLTES